MTSKIVVNNIEADSGINTITFINEVTAPTFNGNIVGTAATFSGNVDIAGALTYEDVTNVDSVGIVTARSGIHVTGGSVGLGTDNPSQLLHLHSDSAHQILLKRGGQYPSECKFSNSGNLLTISNNKNGIHFDVGSSSLATAMYIEDGGNIGIGTDNPSVLLHLADTEPQFYIQDSNSVGNNVNATLQFRDSSNSQLSYFGYAGTSDSNLSLFNTMSGGALRLGTTGAERLRITSGGNIGIGTDNPGQKLTVKGTTSLMATNSTNQWMAYTYTDNTFRLNYNGAGADEVTINSNGDVSLLQNLIIPEDKKIFLEGDADDDYNAIWKDDAENALMLTSRYKIANIIDSNNDDTDSFWSVRHNGVDIAGSGELMRVQSNGIVKFGGQSYANASKSGGVTVGNSTYFDITGSSYVFVKIMIKVGYTGNANYQMHAQYDYVTCNYYTAGGTATRTDILQVEAANAQFNYSDISITRPSNRTVRVIYAPTSGAGTHHPVLSVSGVFDSITVT